MEEGREALREFARFIDAYGEWFPFVLFAALVLFIMPLVAKISGWSLLATHYAAQLPFSGDTFRFRSAQFRGHSNYGNCLTFGTDAFGLHIAVFPLFRLGHTPLYVPWSEIRAREVRAWLMPAVEFYFEKAPQVTMRISRSLAESLLERTLPPVKIQPL